MNKRLIAVLVIVLLLSVIASIQLAGGGLLKPD